MPFTEEAQQALSHTQRRPSPCAAMIATRSVQQRQSSSSPETPSTKGEAIALYAIREMKFLRSGSTRHDWEEEVFTAKRAAATKCWPNLNS